VDANPFKRFDLGSDAAPFGQLKIKCVRIIAANHGIPVRLSTREEQTHLMLGAWEVQAGQFNGDHLGWMHASVVDHARRARTTRPPDLAFDHTAATDWPPARIKLEMLAHTTVNIQQVSIRMLL
jgi:hypothetical protein